MGLEIDETNNQFLANLFSRDPSLSCHTARSLRNSVIGSNRGKNQVISSGLLPHLLDSFSSSDLPPQVIYEVLVTLNSLARGSSDHANLMARSHVVTLLFKGLQCWVDNPDELCLLVPALRCLRSVLSNSFYPLADQTSVGDLAPLLLSCSAVSNDDIVHECVMTSLALLCRSADDQECLLKTGVTEFVCSFLCSVTESVLTACLRLLSALCFNNCVIAEHVTKLRTGDVESTTVVERLSGLTGRGQSALVQLESARCLCCLHRSGTLAVDSSHPCIVYRALPALVRLCGAKYSAAVRVAAADTLAYLLEVDVGLQRIAFQMDHLMEVVTTFLGFRPSSNHPNTRRRQQHMAKQMKRSAFMVFASLASNDTSIRTRVADVTVLLDLLLQCVQQGLPSAPGSAILVQQDEEQLDNAAVSTGASGRWDSATSAQEAILAPGVWCQDSVEQRLLVAALKCLLSLSRSVHTLRTVLQDCEVWLPVLSLTRAAALPVCRVDSSAVCVAVAGSAVLCNLVLEFCPARQRLVSHGCVDLFCQLTRHSHPALRLNATWSLMNLAYQAEHRVKRQIMCRLGANELFGLMSDSAPAILMKTLGLLRNVLSRPHVDQFMDASHGQHVMQAVVLTLEGEHSAEVKEQALCLLSNIANGIRARDFIMDNEDVLKKLVNYMVHSDVRLITASVVALVNLVRRNEDGSRERQARLRRMGVVGILQSLQCTSIALLFDAVKNALFHFS